MKDENPQELKHISELLPIVSDTAEQIIYELGIDENNIPKIQFMYILLEINKRVVEPNKYLLKIEKHKNSYDSQAIIILYNHYKLLCYRYKQMIDIKSFCYLMNTSYNTLSNIYINNNMGDSLNTNSINIAKMILEDSEQSNVLLMADAKNVIAYQTILNNRFGWSATGIARTERDELKQTALTDAKSLFELYQNQTQLIDIDAESGDD